MKPPLEPLAVNTTPPVVTLNGEPTMALKVGDAYNDEGATATDDVDGSLSVTITGTVDTNTTGEYVKTYTATDSLFQDYMSYNMVVYCKVTGIIHE